MKSSHVLAIALAVGAIVWVMSGHFGGEGASTEDAPVSAAESHQAHVDARAPTKVRVATSTAQPYVLTLSVTGRTEANRDISLRVQTSGRIETIEAEEGEVVEEGQVITRIAMDDRSQRLSRAEALVEQFRIAFNASAELAASGWRAETANAEALANLRGAQAELAAIMLDIERTEITAPFRGVLDAIGIEVGEVVEEGFGESDAIGHIFDLDPFIVVAAVSERDVGLLTVGDVGEAHLITGETVSGVLRYIGQVAEPETRTFRIELEVPNPDLRIAAGLTTQVILPLLTIPSHFISPSALSLADNGDLGVKVVDPDNIVRFVPVQVVANSDGGLWITGLPDEVTLITVGHDFVAAGEVVEPVRVEGSAFSGAS
ncbi:MAG: efflux RND transporter periplasmic adaptor subunit [Rhodospirillales bacterium]|nr:efflux RND transporter periplasmic adaptor subunit [Rhodospirillales bacterium]